MIELKTLKDLEEEFEDIKGSSGKVYLAILKAEAVKWIKEDRGLRKDNTIWTINGDELLDLLEDRWMKRLNITEEDLKEKGK